MAILMTKKARWYQEVTEMILVSMICSISVAAVTMPRAAPFGQSRSTPLVDACTQPAKSTVQLSTRTMATGTSRRSIASHDVKNDKLSAGQNFSTTTEQSAPGWCIDTFGLAGSPVCTENSNPDVVVM